MAGISSDIIRGYNDTIILYLLLDKPSYGYEISKQIKAMTNEKYIVKETTLYSAFTRMEKNGYIEEKQDEKDSRKSRIYFTEKGRSICEDGHKKFVMIQEKLQEYFTKEEQEELKRLLNKFCDCLDEQTEILKKERKEKSDA